MAPSTRFNNNAPLLRKVPELLFSAMLLSLIEMCLRDQPMQNVTLTNHDDDPAFRLMTIRMNVSIACCAFAFIEKCLKLQVK